MHGPKGSVTVAEIASIAHLRMHELPPGVEPLLDATATYEPGVDTGVYSYATHGAVVAVDPDTGAIELLDFAVVEDCGADGEPDAGRGPNPRRSSAGDRHRPARRDSINNGEPLAATFLDYHLPGAYELPAIQIGHLHTKATATEYGMKGMGEGGAVVPPAAIANAVSLIRAGARRCRDPE